MQNSRGPSLISAFPQHGAPWDWGSSRTGEKDLWVQVPLGMATSVLAGPGSWSRCLPRARPRAPSLPGPRRCVPLAVWATETNKNIFRLF